MTDLIRQYVYMVHGPSPYDVLKGADVDIESMNLEADGIRSDPIRRAKIESIMSGWNRRQPWMCSGDGLCDVEDRLYRDRYVCKHCGASKMVERKARSSGRFVNTVCKSCGKSAKVLAGEVVLVSSRRRRAKRKRKANLNSYINYGDKTCHPVE